LRRGMDFGVLLTTPTKPIPDLKVPRNDIGNQKAGANGRPASNYIDWPLPRALPAIATAPG
jgi:hypothetical protein